MNTRTPKHARALLLAAAFACPLAAAAVPAAPERPASPSRVAPGQDQHTPQDRDPGTLLDRLERGMHDLGTITAEFAVVGKGPAMLGDTLPGGSGRLWMRRADTGWELRMLGVYKEKRSDTETKRLDVIVRDGTVSVMTEDGLYEASIEQLHRVDSSKLGTLRLFVPALVLGEDPPAWSTQRASEATSAPAVEIDGHQVPQVQLAFEDLERTAAGPSESVHRVAVNAKGVPVRVVRYEGVAGIEIELGIELRNIETNARVEDSRFTRSPEDEAQPASALAEPLPAFEAVTADGTRVSNASLLGQPAALVFAASWQARSRLSLDAIDPLAEAGRVIVFALREREPAELKSSLPDGVEVVPLGEAAAKAIGVRRLPVVIVIDREGAVVFRRELTADDQAAEMMTAAAYALLQAAKKPAPGQRDSGGGLDTKDAAPGRGIPLDGGR